MLNIDEIRAVTNKTTPGPWIRRRSGVIDSDGCTLAIMFNLENNRNDAIFTASARAWVPALCDEVDRLTTTNAALRMRLQMQGKSETPVVIALQQQNATLKVERDQNQTYADIYRDICDKWGKNFQGLLEKAKSLTEDNAVLHRALEMAEQARTSNPKAIKELSELHIKYAREGTEK